MAIVEFEAVEDGPASKVLGPPVSPFDVPDMSIWDAVYWVASEGGAKDFDVTEVTVWVPAIVAVVSKIISGEIPLSGRRSQNAIPETLPANTLSGMIDNGMLVKDHVVHPYQGASADADLVHYDGLRLDLGDPDGDRLFSPAGDDTRSNLRISSANLVRFWSFASVPTGIDGLTEVKTSSGWMLQGVPSSSSQPLPIVDVGDAVTLSVPARPLQQNPAVLGVGRKRGAKPTVFDRVVEAMRNDLASGSLTAAVLDQTREKVLEEKYGASRDTCRKARAAVLADGETQNGSQA